MKILCLYNNDCAVELFEWLSSQGHETVLWNKRISAEWCMEQDFDLTVSYTYRYILTSEVLDALNGNAVNIHNAYLPWNRGADPNIWSILDRTPRGVTLHYINAELDKGSIIAQQIVADGEEETLASAYDNLDRAAKYLFKNAFVYYNFWKDMRKEPIAGGSYHTVSDAKRVRELFDSYTVRIPEFRRRYMKMLGKSGGGERTRNPFIYGNFRVRCMV